MMDNTKGKEFWQRALNHPSFVAGGALVCFLIASALLSCFWSPYLPADIDIPNKLASSSASHWFGTDSLGRDVASQLLVGSQTSIAVGVIAVSIGLTLGAAFGLWAAVRGGWIDELIMRAADFTFAFPALLLAILLTAIYGPGLLVSITAIGIFNIPVFARITRGAAKVVLARDYIKASRSAGKTWMQITVDHLLPNIASVLIVQATVQFAVAILAEAALSYLGLGTQAPQPSWGRMLNEAQAQLFQAPMLAIYPGAAIALAVLGLNLMGDGLRDLLDPKLQSRR